MYKVHSILLAAFGLIWGSSSALAGEATCWCRASYMLLAPNYEQSANSPGVFKDYTSTVNLKFSGVFPQSPGNQNQCIAQCKTAASGDVHSQTIANQLCQLGITYRRIWTYAAVGTRKYDFAQSLGLLTNEPKKVTCPSNSTQSGETCVMTVPATKTCPNNWLSNTSGQNASITLDGICKKMVTGCALPGSAPQSGSLIGNYGVVENGNIYVYGNSANGG
ncbi:MAG: hypothetical protein EBX52_10465, partial [Proteobacteria bacterium]|nr:hypothetical protein [Pseudomonadota bacterium]